MTTVHKDNLHAKGKYGEIFDGLRGKLLRQPEKAALLLLLFGTNPQRMVFGLSDCRSEKTCPRLRPPPFVADVRV